MLLQLQTNDSAVLIKEFLLKHSAPLMKPTCKSKKCGKAFIKLPDDVKKARSQGKVPGSLKLPTRGQNSRNLSCLS